MNRWGQKPVKNRHDDALSRLKWDRLESVVGDYYRERGYSVDHCGTGGNGRRFDGGIDLKLRRGGEYLLVQCKHTNAYQVTHNTVHELFGVVASNGATGGIVVTSGEFTPAALSAARRLDNMQLIDGKALRSMLGPLPDEAEKPAMDIRLSAPVASAAGTFATNAAERRVPAAEDRIRHGGGRGRGVAKVATASLAGVLLKGAIAVAVLAFAMSMIPKIFGNLGDDLVAKSRQAELQRVERARVAAKPLPAPEVPVAAPRRTYERPDPQPARGVAEVGSKKSAAELREWRRKNAESMKILEASTAEMPLAR